MSDAAPPYDSSGSPPAYEEIEKKLNELIGPNPTVEKVLKAAKSVSPKEAEILVQNSKAKFPLKTERQKEDFALGIASATSSDDFKPQITSASSSASRAANEVARIFQKLHLKILEVDRVHESGFAKVLLKHKDHKTDDQMKTAEGFKKDSSLLDSRFQDLITDFSTFVDGFSEWAKDKEKELSDKIKKVEEEIKALKKKLVDLKIARDVFALIGASILPILAILLEVFKPAAIPILIAGLIAAGVTMAIIIGLLVAIQLIEHELEMKEDEKKKLEDQKELIRATRTELVTLGSESLLSFKLSEEPKYMKDNLNNAVTVSDSVMAQYMEEYARGVESQGN
ncbi:hypothetical protein J7337_000036 [Fusarium musae]|uniref:Uncharacterized protein n=1 Tax=Fusarium musae TaxID=1042133 RepID=A0A9P8DQZ5_9HYPO|nr:hypothetical protein J7337_000036 [Fusarium musae]KAG9506504.1 hypothetical protein J7337_000036 [Fusarium musae]